MRVLINQSEKRVDQCKTQLINWVWAPPKHVKYLEKKTYFKAWTLVFGWLPLHSPAFSSGFSLSLPSQLFPRSFFSPSSACVSFLFLFFFPPKGWARAEEVTRQLLERAGSKCWRLYRAVLNINQTHERDLSAARFVFTVKLIQSFCEWVSLVTNVTNGSCHEVCVCLIFLRECCQNVNTAKKQKPKNIRVLLTNHTFSELLQFWGSFLLILLEGPPNFLIARKLLL